MSDPPVVAICFVRISRNTLRLASGLPGKGNHGQACISKAGSGLKLELLLYNIMNLLRNQSLKL